jgi:hypothetical protein
MAADLRSAVLLTFSPTLSACWADVLRFPETLETIRSPKILGDNAKVVA